MKSKYIFAFAVFVSLSLAIYSTVARAAGTPKKSGKRNETTYCTQGKNTLECKAVADEREPSFDRIGPPSKKSGPDDDDDDGKGSCEGDPDGCPDDGGDPGPDDGGDGGVD